MLIAEAVITRILGDMAASALSLVFSSLSEDDGRLELWSVALEDQTGEVVGIMTSDQAEDLERFLESIEVRSIFQAHFLGRLAEADGCDTGQFFAEIGQAFTKLAERWCGASGRNWSTLAPDIWDNLATRMAATLPAVTIRNALTPDEIGPFREQVATAATRSKAPKGFLRDLLDMSTDLERITATRNTVTDLRRQLTECYAQIRLDHAQHDFRIQIDKLYIDRDLIRYSTREHLSSVNIFSGRNRIRLVVTGDPGIGKSTFTEYMIRQLSETPDGNVAPLVIQCREYVASGDRGLVPTLKETIAANLQLRVSEQNIEDILTLGWGTVIIDGVDEILDLGQRRKLIRAVEALAMRFPLCSIIATSRNVGYSDAQFNQARFIRYELRSFTKSQIKEYASKWFVIAGRPESHLSKFLADLASIPDLRGNPLMLSLLCVLYRDRGHIPRNRRQVYSQCADLLFNRWDPMRHIEQPYDHQHYGDELMQEIARWFYKSQAAQAGLEEQQLRHVIAGFLKDTASVPGQAADRRAAAFLDFCADRAWLLGVAGTNDRGQRLFVFTHRTFMEFFTAESLVRTLDIEDIVGEVAEVYNKDASSVLPDLIVQSAEFHRRGGARQIISGLLERGGGLGKRHLDKYLPLCLRIINLSPVYPSLLDKIFDRTITSWTKTSPASSRASTTCVLELYRDPHSRFVDLLKNDVDCMRRGECETGHQHAIINFLLRWGHFYMSDLTASYDEEWGSFIAEMMPIVLPQLVAIHEDTLTQFLIDSGYLSATNDIGEYLVAHAFDTSVAGCAFRSVERVLLGNTRAHDEAMVESLSELATKGASLDSAFAPLLDLVARDRSERFPYHLTGIAGRDLTGDRLGIILLWLGCVIFEARGSMNPLHDIISGALGFECKSLFDTRSFHLDKVVLAKRPYKATVQPDEEAVQKEYGSVLSASDLQRLARSYRPWIRSWCLAKKDFLTYTAHPDDEDA